MKLQKTALLIIVFKTAFIFGQTKKTPNDSIISFEERINIRLLKALNLVYKIKYNKALMLTLQCLKESDSIKNDSLIGKSYITAGIINSVIGKKKLAILNHKKAEKIFVRTKNYKYLGSAYNSIGLAYNNYLKKIDTTKAINQKKTDSIKTHYRQGLDSVKKYYKKALDNYVLANAPGRTAHAFCNLGNVYTTLNDFTNAKLMLKKALNIAQTHVKNSTTNTLISYIYLYYSDIYIKNENFNKAKEYINISEKIAVKYKHDNALIDIFKNKSKILDRLGDSFGSYKYLKKYNELLVQLHEKEKFTLTLEASAKFEAKEQKDLLVKERLEFSIKKNKLKKSKLLINFTITLLIISCLVAFLLKKNNLLKLENNKLLVIKNKKLKELQLKTELNFLRTQIQPHFFFNTLNNLYALIIEKSDKAKDVVIKLSELIKYTIYGSKKVTTPIIDEINNIKNYLELESLRYGKKVLPSIKIEGNMDGINVPPMLFITFIENSFKHNDVRDDNFKLSITFKTLSSKYFHFKVENTLTDPRKDKEGRKKGIGIENIKRRLLLLYKDDYKLSS